ncbi:Late endosomal/lysosomal adaptor and MAPK and MTOR activator 1 [Caenorhabditis elegans]|uniref:Late endosomal/lysosomal adaptor and MAPK and MTOR activator 1 n=1 Tax=Caenorhabditis elegans TaxID=6239 RepID=H2L0K4_CAEEL|nr:Late endosomal/lysosomal adaptor and MAPK and MTOR activator 1 [Caenorhabditis elegans]CCD74316.1 Late endosomal/lysosomal adaptor and MAPK and MTOR activator 1 [Caenorhabditis elegans]|eukprot:NP_741522.1 Uncharacterized protein CELE_Y45G5AL.1 [Caenorhabditis elegans]
MDGIFRLFCGCCGIQGEEEPPYSQLRHDSVTPIRDPPLQQGNRQATNGAHQHNPLQHQGFVNPVHEYNYDATDGPNMYPSDHHGMHSDSASPPSGDFDEEIVEDEGREKEQLDNIVESTQHSIIAVGQTDVDGVIMPDTQYREKAYRAKVQKMACAPPSVIHYTTIYDFEFEPTQTPIQVPIRYDEISATIEPSPIERMPFSAPDFNQLKLARTMGAKNPQFLVEHPDLKSAGRSQGITSSMKAKVTQVLDEVHQGVVGVEVEPRDLIVSMDF